MSLPVCFLLPPYAGAPLCLPREHDVSEISAAAFQDIASSSDGVWCLFSRNRGRRRAVAWTDTWLPSPSSLRPIHLVSLAAGEIGQILLDWHKRQNLRRHIGCCCAWWRRGGAGWGRRWRRGRRRRRRGSWGSGRGRNKNNARRWRRRRGCRRCGSDRGGPKSHNGDRRCGGRGRRRGCRRRDSGGGRGVEALALPLDVLTAPQDGSLHRLSRLLDLPLEGP